MKQVIIGTAGHVDHGKTCLVKAMTGIDTDRLREEKKRGITIELGFAYLDLPDGQRAGIIDVPGHEKFIKNMLAGAGGIDIAMLAVAADEGVMPQTVEHLDILSMLEMKQGVIVLTKSDLVEEDFADLVCEEIKEIAAGTFLENAPVVRVSAFTGTGIPQLKELLYGMVSEVKEKNLREDFRIPIDRVFTMKGFGTVVTGTLIEGTFSEDQKILLYPEKREVKVRNIQVHSKDAAKAWAGQRVAVNLANLKKDEIHRGDILAPAGSLECTRMVDVKLKATAHTERTVKNNSRVHLYHGSRELIGKVVLMDREELEPGKSAYAQLRLEEHEVFKKGDHFVIRFYSPVETVGGGTVLDPLPFKHKRYQKKVLSAFDIKENGTPVQQLEQAVREQRGRFLKLSELCRYAGLDKSRLINDARRLEENHLLVRIKDDILVHSEDANKLQKRLTSFIHDFHKQSPLKEGMPLEEVRSRLRLKKDPAIVDGVIAYFKRSRIIKAEDGLISAYAFRVKHLESDSQLIQEIEAYYKEAGFSPPTQGTAAKRYEKEKRYRDVLSGLLKQRILVHLDDQYCIHIKYYEQAAEVLLQQSRRKKQILLGEYRDALGSSRKMAVALLEYFDKKGITRKVGDARFLRNSSVPE